ncbi:MuF-like minor capsid protein [Mycobacterium phage Candle]|uniref:MuF-like minor capsid protein n=2 Tax=Papyrusvirus send513 TaxID=1982556 RepID=A0A4D6T7N4_9CAUD|nr:MuF-like minor capsid protein [Mycobacterium phage Zenon]QCG78119.1 MuF-like minor capsid protein [Mycobacterium phage Candle]
MTLPLPKTPKVNTKAIRENWLGRYLAVEKGADKRLFAALVEATKDIDSTLASLKDVKSKTAATRRLQLALAHKEIRKRMNSLYGDVSDIIKTSQSSAAKAAVDAALKDEERLLSKILPNPVDRAQYAASLRATAERNIEATMTRVLETNRPLSKKVWKTRALSQGMVDRAINNALARGDSFEKLARDVRHLIDPNTPGGVTYAAKRLARTEINNAFHAQSIRDAQEKPWVTSMRWNLSKVHMDDPKDPCEHYAKQGLFPIDKVPDKPHPHCRCFVTPEEADDEMLEHMFNSGQLDDYLDNFIEGGDDAVPLTEAIGSLKGGPEPFDMIPSPPEPATTKAAQPKGWTGPLVAKAAANETVRATTNSIWKANVARLAFLNKAREGSRIVETKGYRGGLSSAGKKAMLGHDLEVDAPDSMALDVGRELTARIAYSEGTTQELFHAINLESADIERLISGSADISIPLTQVSTTAADAFEAATALKNTETRVLLRFKEGTKAAEIDPTRQVTMGWLKVNGGVKRSEPSGGHYYILDVEQRDVREFEAFTPEGQTIPDFELIQENKLVSAATKVDPSDTKKVAGSPVVEPEPEFKTVRQRISESKDIFEIRTILKEEYYFQLNNWDDQHLDLASAKEIALGLEKNISKYPEALDTLTHVEIWPNDAMDGAYAHVQPEWDGSSKLRLNVKFANNYAQMEKSKKSGETRRWTTTGAGTNPWDATITHEFGHVLDWRYTRMDSWKDLNAIMESEYAKANPAYKKDNHTLAGRKKLVSRWLGERDVIEDYHPETGEKKAFYRHIGGAPSGYSVSKPNDWGFNPAELVAESFTDVERNGDGAKPTSKAVHKWLMRKRKKLQQEGVM